MYLARNTISMKFYFSLFILFAYTQISHANEKYKTDSIKAIVIREVMKKVSNITMNTLYKIPEAKKKTALSVIENKLKKSAKGLPNSNKYIKFIMEEFKRNTFEKKANITKQTNYIKKANIKEQVNNLKNSKKSYTGKKENDNLVSAQTKQVIILDIANKIASIAKAYLKDSQTLDQKKNILHKIEHSIIAASKRKHMQIHNKHSELKNYVQLITQGLELCIKTLLNNESRRMEDIPEDAMFNNTMHKVIHAANMEYINQYKTFFSEVLNETAINPQCDKVVDEICLRISSLHKLSCGDENIIFLEQLCDGVPDCWSGADETNCIPQVTEKVLLAIPLITAIERSFTTKCFQAMMDLETLSHHHKVLKDMLKSQLSFLQNYKFITMNSKTSSEKESPDNDDNETNLIYLKKSIRYIGMSVSSLSYALEENLCLREVSMPKINAVNTRKFFSNGSDDFIDYDNIKSKTTWSAKSCNCRQQFCTTDDCDNRCKHICWQKYILNRWGCQSITGDQSVSLNSICDGKLDCYDESDETACAFDLSHSKYEANNVYNYLIEILSLKSLSLEYEHSRNKIVALIDLVQQLQKLTTKYQIDIHAVKALRREYFKTLVYIYDGMMSNSNLDELDRNHNFLLVLNQKMVYAMKRSHTGNENVVAPTGCYCLNGKCALLRCTPKCIATCSVEPMLTTYSCKVNNVSVYLKDICNGKVDCPNKQDEKYCVKDICRSHHLVMLRHNLKKTGVNLKGTLLGEVLEAWKAKVMSALIVAENGDRPNHKMLEDVIRNILNDLVTAYSSIEETKKTKPELVLREFKAMADIVMETLKLCGQ